MDAVEQVERSRTASAAKCAGGVSPLSAHLLGSVPLGDKASVLLAGRHSDQSSLYDKILDLGVDGGQI